MSLALQGSRTGRYPNLLYAHCKFFLAVTPNSHHKPRHIGMSLVLGRTCRSPFGGAWSFEPVFLRSMLPVLAPLLRLLYYCFNLSNYKKQSTAVPERARTR